MHTSDFLRLYVSAEKSFNQATLIEANFTNVTHNETKPQFEIPPIGVLFLVPICFMIVWALVVIVVSGGPKVTRDINRKGTIKRFQQIPCGNCQFFKDNHYLKCAVNPSTVLTKQAIDCSDYWPK